MNRCITHRACLKCVCESVCTERHPCASLAESSAQQCMINWNASTQNKSTRISPNSHCTHIFFVSPLTLREKQSSEWKSQMCMWNVFHVCRSLYAIKNSSKPASETERAKINAIVLCSKGRPVHLPSHILDASRIYVQKDKDYYPFTALIFWHTSFEPLKDSV